MDVWVQLSCGQGPAECQRAVWHVLKKFEKESKERHFSLELINAESGRECKTLRSVLLKLAGKNLQDFQESWQGSICWKAKSPFRPHHKRQNWFVQVTFLKQAAKEDIDLQKIHFEALRGSGPGGQHVNKNSTAIRATYVPNGLSVLCREERSQARNKDLATARLYRLLNKARDGVAKDNTANARLQHYQLERGNPIRTYEDKL